MSSLDFTIYCGRCLSALGDHKGGSVLSCGDFLCTTCAQQLISGSACPACGRTGVRAAFLNDSLPDEVRMKYYKQIIRKAVYRLQQLESELAKKNAMIKDLESRIHNQPQTQPFFMSKDPSVATPLMAPLNLPSQQNTFLPPPQQQRPQQGTSIPPFQHNSTYFDSSEQRQPARSTNVHHQLPTQTNSPKHEQYTPGYTAAQWTDTGADRSTNFHHPEQEIPLARLSQGYPQQPMHPSGAQEPRVQYLSEEDRERRRLFTPTRTIFSSNHAQRHNLASPKLRSPAEPLVRSPSQPLFNPIKSNNRVVEMYRVNHQQSEARSSFSPMSSFLRKSGFS